MKKILAVVFAIIFSASIASAAYNNIGYVDVQKVFQDFKETSKAQKELSAKEEAFKKELRRLGRQARNKE